MNEKVSIRWPIYFPNKKVASLREPGLERGGLLRIYV